MEEKRQVYKVENKVGEWIILQDGKKVGEIHEGRRDFRIYFYNGFVYYRADIDHAKEVARHGEAGLGKKIILPKQQVLNFAEKKKAKQQVERGRKMDAELVEKIRAAADTEVQIQKVNENTFDVSRTVKSAVANRWAERIQKISGVTVVGTKDEIDGDEMAQTVRVVLRAQVVATTTNLDWRTEGRIWN